ncbi:PepSY-associated TM helix domain-containing protein [Filimonas effusa]|uniref:PepSY domain-containing protein n=1 Tax=Filimonas effusa TaxID=2508721 RepID=A0A4Q1D3F7_9BACT|nr:PepSY-associated TM helix domain-containing protein [Filimonas effusa]RXK82952.1 PepSY domain-containing protein [Filimonas effusa]
MKVTSSVKPGRKKGAGWLSKLNSWLHLWLGLVSGIIVFVVCLSGSLFVFCDEIIDGINHRAIYVQEVKERQLSTEALLLAFKKQMPEHKPFYFVAYKDPKRSFKVASADKRQHFKFTWLDPYTGKVLKTNGAYYFFYTVAHIHAELLLHDTGSLIVEIATWIFLIELVTGLVLWWPKKWTNVFLDMCFKIKWKGKWKRVNYDLHNVLGFYSLIPTLLLTVTGLIIVNKPVNKVLHTSLGGKQEPYRELRKLAAAYSPGAAAAPLDTVIQRLFKLNSSVWQVRLTIPPKDSVTFYYAIAAAHIGLKSHDGQMLLIDKYSGKSLPIPAQLVKGERIESVNMNLHIGFWYGWIGKMITFVAGLIATSLPITGFLVWWGRTHKKKNKAGRPRQHLVVH